MLNLLKKLFYFIFFVVFNIISLFLNAYNEPGIFLQILYMS